MLKVTEETAGVAFKCDEKLEVWRTAAPSHRKESLEVDQATGDSGQLPREGHHQGGGQGGGVATEEGWTHRWRGGGGMDR